MNDSCDRWERWLDDSDNGERDRHLATCSDCREQWSAHLALSGLAEVPLPPLSRDLGPIVGRAVADHAPASMLTPTQRLMMRLYWLAATFAAGLVLAQLGSASIAWIFFWAFVAALGLAGLPALLLLRRRLSWGLMDLLVWTLR